MKKKMGAPNNRSERESNNVLCFVFVSHYSGTTIDVFHVLVVGWWLAEKWLVSE